ncbi:CBS domain-containing protein [Halorubrum sp. FL23]|uniref:CBS domain-containing protein n=1 Tax=Halorubrum sp. FL23 TaxID=3458704 RepID=UPI0040345606
MLVEDVMTTDLVTCDARAPVRVAVERMLRNRVGSVVVTNEGSPAGIVTEADVLHAGYATDDPFSEIPLRKTMSSPLETIQPRKPLRTATDRMRTEGIKKLVVVDGLTPVGIVTTGDIVDNYAGIKREVRDLASDAERWSSRGDRFDE